MEEKIPLEEGEEEEAKEEEGFTVSSIEGMFIGSPMDEATSSYFRAASSSSLKYPRYLDLPSTLIRAIHFWLCLCHDTPLNVDVFVWQNTGFSHDLFLFDTPLDFDDFTGLLALTKKKVAVASLNFRRAARFILRCSKQDMVEAGSGCWQNEGVAADPPQLLPAPASVSPQAPTPELAAEEAAAVERDPGVAVAVTGLASLASTVAAGPMRQRRKTPPPRKPFAQNKDP